MSIDVYKNCPSFENESYLLRMVEKEDTADLLKVYSDEKAVPFFNSDNCGGDDFHYRTEDRMEQAIEYWLWEYGRRGFVPAEEKLIGHDKTAYDSYFVLR